MDTRLGVVIVTYDSAAMLPSLLASLAEHERSAAVVVVDNASPGGPPRTPEGVGLLTLDQNFGYGFACNAGRRHLGGRGVTHVAFLNPDVRLEGPSLTQLAAGMAGRSRVGVATGPIVDAQGVRSPSAWGQTSTIRAFWFTTGWQLPRLRAAVGRIARSSGANTSGASMVAKELSVDGHVLGGAMVADADCFDEVEGFDDGFFMFWEDADLCHRVRNAGWEIRVLPCTPIVHRAGTSSAGITDEQRRQWYLEGAELFARKHLTVGARRRLLLALRLGNRFGRIMGRR